MMDLIQTRTRRAYQRDSKENRRDALINAVLKLIGEGGPQAVTVRAIAKEAGVTAGLIRHYFQSKEELVRAAYSVLMNRLMVDLILMQQSTDPTERLAHFVATMLRPPIVDSAKVVTWAGFLYLMRSDSDTREIYSSTYRSDLGILRDLIADIHRDYGASKLRSASIACLAVLDGLWLEASLISDSFAPEEIVAVGLSAIGAILRVDLMAAHAR